ncbi:hypothetical protein M405DRAFT_835498 [Rhizopogon salebrosus TDB-379]|nr:hypothetical protein M405DRAFT_835498 [Rhizopogon salebrosus TDB-379]
MYPALLERATSDPSQSRRRGPHLADHENIKAELVPPAKRICPLSMMLHELECAEEADENEDGNGDKQNESKEDRDRARREELG